MEGHFELRLHSLYCDLFYVGVGVTMNNQKCRQTLFLNPLYIQELKLFISKVYSVYPLRIFPLFVQVYKPLMEILCCCNDTQIG